MRPTLVRVTRRTFKICNSFLLRKFEYVQFTYEWFYGVIRIAIHPGKVPSRDTRFTNNTVFVVTVNASVQEPPF